MTYWSPFTFSFSLQKGSVPVDEGSDGDEEDIDFDVDDDFEGRPQCLRFYFRFSPKKLAHTNKNNFVWADDEEDMLEHYLAVK